MSSGSIFQMHGGRMRDCSASAQRRIVSGGCVHLNQANATLLHTTLDGCTASSVSKEAHGGGVAMIGGAFKYVLCHHTIKEYQGEMGVLAFTFWVELFVGAMLCPWAILNGEAQKLMFETEQPFADWALLWFTGAYGGVRVGPTRERYPRCEHGRGLRA